MGYCITYQKSIVKKNLPVVRKSSRSYKWLSFAIICILIVFALSSRKVRNTLLPGNPQVTERALTELVDDLREGESVTAAVTSFCREILDNA